MSKTFDLDKIIDQLNKIAMVNNDDRQKEQEELSLLLEKFKKETVDKIVEYVNKNEEECKKHGIRIMTHPELLSNYTYLILSDIAYHIESVYDVSVEITCSHIMPKDDRIYVMSREKLYGINDLHQPATTFEAVPFNEYRAFSTSEKKLFRGAFIANINDL